MITHNPATHSSFSVRCSLCSTVSDHSVPKDGLFAYRQGAMIQEAFDIDEVSPSDREAVMSFANKRPHIGDCCF